MKWSNSRFPLRNIITKKEKNETENNSYIYSCNTFRDGECIRDTKREINWNAICFSFSVLVLPLLNSASDRPNEEVQKYK